MKLLELKIGDTIKHYCCGQIVTAKVVRMEANGIVTEHEPVRWGRDEYTETFIYPATEQHIQSMRFASNPVETIPSAWYNDEQIKR